MAKNYEIRGGYQYAARRRAMLWNTAAIVRSLRDLFLITGREAEAAPHACPPGLEKEMDLVRAIVPFAKFKLKAAGTPFRILG